MKLLDVFGKLSKKSITYMILIAKLTNYRFKYSLSGTFFYFPYFSLKLFLHFQLKMLTNSYFHIIFYIFIFVFLTASVSPFRKSLFKMQYPSLSFEA